MYERTQQPPTKDAQSLWSETLEAIRPHISHGNFVRWFKPLRPRLEGKTLVLLAPNKYIRDWFETNFLSVVRESLRSSLALDLQVLVRVAPEQKDPNLEPSSESPASRESAPQPRQPTRRKRPTVPPLPPQYTFDNFVVGPSNQLAHAAAMAAAAAPGDRYNPLFVYGGVGLGKTHLLCAIGNEILIRNQTSRVLYVTSEQFTIEYVSSVRAGRADEFRKKYRQDCDVLLVDDIQFIAGKDKTQEEFFHTFNALYETGRQIVLTSDRFPHEISGLEDRLRNRFQWGLIADIQSPEYETRLAIVQKKAAQQGLLLPGEVAEFLAESIRSNVRQLEGALVRLSAYASLDGRPITRAFAEQVLSSLLTTASKPPQAQDIIREVASFFHLRPSDLTGKRRLKNISEARRIAMFLVRELTPLSFPEIGRLFGGKNHSTVMSSVRKVAASEASDAQVRNILQALRRRLNPEQ